MDTLERRALISKRRLDVELIDVHIKVVLCVGNSGTQDFLNYLGTSLRREFQNRERFSDVLATDQIHDDANFARSDANIFSYCFRFHKDSPFAKLLQRGLSLFAGMAFERARRCELTELVANHVFRDVNRYVLAAIVDSNRVTDEIREIVELLDQVLTTFLSLASFRAVIFFIRLSAT